MPTINNNKVEFKSGEALPAVGTPEYLQAQSGIVPTVGDKPITSSDLMPTTPVKVAPNPTTTVANPIIDTATTINTAERARLDAKAKADAEIAKTKVQVTSDENALRGLYDELGLSGQRTIKAEESAGLSKLETDYNEITSQIEAKQLSARRQIEDLDKNPQGLFGGALEAEKNRINRENAREIADLSIIQSARGRNLATAQDMVNRKVALETEDLKNRFEATKFFYENNKEILTKAEQREFDSLTKRLDREYNDEKDRVKTLEATKLKYLDIAIENGKGNEVLASLQGAKTLGELANIAGDNNLVSTDALIKRAQLEGLVNKGLITPEEAKKRIQAEESAYEQNRKNVTAVNNALNNLRGLKIVTGNLGLVGRTFSRIGNLGTGVRGQYEKGGLAQANEFLSSADYILNNLTFDKLISLKSQGATFGALSDNELRAIGNSADELASFAIRDDNGQIVGFRGDEATIEQKFTDIRDKYNKALDKQNASEALSAEELSDPILYK